MCRLLVVRDDEPFDPGEVLRPFAAAARASKEYQGDGWGCARRTPGGWERYRTVVPIWEDRLDGFGPTRTLVAHARSAFRNEGVVVENNMPFVEGENVFAFNGELRGVRIAEAGDTGAAKLFRFLLRIGGLHPVEALARGLDLVARRTRYVRAINLVVGAGHEILVASRFNEDPAYFTMRWVTRGTRRIVASDPIDAGSDWVPIANGTVMALR